MPTSSYSHPHQLTESQKQALQAYQRRRDRQLSERQKMALEAYQRRARRINRAKRQDRLATRLCLKRWGCDVKTYRSLRGRTMAMFQQQRQSARRRGIPWHLTLGDWWRIWEQSGRWNERGRGHGHYVMSRTGDL
jgi:hypothetical protein